MEGHQICYTLQTKTLQSCRSPRDFIQLYIDDFKGLKTATIIFQLTANEPNKSVILAGVYRTIVELKQYLTLIICPNAAFYRIILKTCKQANKHMLCLLSLSELYIRIHYAIPHSWFTPSLTIRFALSLPEYGTLRLKCSFLLLIQQIP